MSLPVPWTFTEPVVASASTPTWLATVSAVTDAVPVRLTSTLPLLTLASTP